MPVISENVENWDSHGAGGSSHYNNILGQFGNIHKMEAVYI